MFFKHKKPGISQKEKFHTYILHFLYSKQRFLKK